MVLITHALGPMNEYLGYACFIFIGLILGLIGGGGSMLAVPVLIYILNFPVNEATSYSLFIIGLTSLFGAFTFLRKGDFNLEAIYLFAIPSLSTVFLTRKFLLPIIRNDVFTIANITVTKQLIIMLLFTVLIIFSSVSMIRKKKNIAKTEMMWGEFYRSPLHFPFIIILAMLVGLISGIVGAGGGFMIIPVLVIFMKTSMKKAVGTSLIIIAINSLVGFTGNIGTFNIDWIFIFIVSVLSIFGIFIGTFVAKFIQGKKLKPLFGWFTLCVGILIITKELFL
jgi:uncharacterized membrane protein YfcA